MTVTEFLEQNVILVAATIFLGGYLIFHEIKNFGMAKSKVTPAQLTRMMNDGATIIDVRSPDLYKKEHISGAINLPLETLESKISTLSKDKTIAVYCERGISSNNAVKALTKAGLECVQLTGGMTNWRQAGLPVAKG